jgi:hypothetical protein
VPEEYTTEQQRTLMHFLWEKGLNAKDINKEMSPVFRGEVFVA